MSTLRKVKGKYGTSTGLKLGIIIPVVEVVIKGLLWLVQQLFIF